VSACVVRKLSLGEGEGEEKGEECPC